MRHYARPKSDRCPWAVHLAPAKKLPGQPRGGETVKIQRWAQQQGAKARREGKPVWSNPLIGWMADSWLRGYRGEV